METIELTDEMRKSIMLFGYQVAHILVDAADQIEGVTNYDPNLAGRLRKEADGIRAAIAEFYEKTKE